MSASPLSSGLRGSRWLGNAQWRFGAVATLLIVCNAATAPAAVAQRQLIKRAAFDEVTLNAANGNEVLEVFPLALPGRRMPATRPTGDLTVELVDQPGMTYNVSWDSIVRIRFHEQILLDEARRLTAAGQYDDAYDLFARLLTDYPSFNGLNEAISDYLRRNALALYQAEQHERALAVLMALYQRDPTSRGLANAVDTVAGQIIDRHLRQQDYAAARTVLTIWKHQFEELDLSAAVSWERRFATAANRHLEQARQMASQRDYVGARRAARLALTIWPALVEAEQLLDEIQQSFGSVTVGVFEASPREPAHRLDSWAAVRASRLVQRTLVEQVGFGSEGGIYRSPCGRLALDESGRRLTLELDATDGARVTSDELVRHLLRMADPADPSYHPEFSDLLAAVSVDDPSTVNLELSRLHVRPEALLQVPLPTTSTRNPQPGAGGPPHFTMADAESGSRVFTAADGDNATSRLRVIVEQTMPDDETAIAALVAGEVDVLDRVPPWQVSRVRATSGVRLGTYRLPTVHVLLPNPQRPLMATREFRRALCYGLERDWIVERVVLGGESRPGFEVLSGPFPAGVSLSDPVRYAYNSQVRPRPFEPRLAAILAAVAWSNVAERTDAGSVDLTQLPKLVLAHPTDPLARLACQTIQLQLARLGMEIQLQPLEADQLLNGDADYDLRYAELAMWEPVVDARRLLGSDGLTGFAGSSPLMAKLRELDEAGNWQGVRSRLSEIHELAHHDLPVIPLWQTVNYFAYRASVSGIGDAPLTLYQHIDQWQTSAAGSP